MYLVFFQIFIIPLPITSLISNSLGSNMSKGSPKITSSTTVPVKPLYAAEGDISSENGRKAKFWWDNEGPEPHAERKVEILKKYPEIRNLMKSEPLTKYTVAATVLLQFTIAYYIQDYSWTTFFIVAYVVGAIASQSLFLAIHELSHRLGSDSMAWNKVYQCMANLPVVVPFAMTFGPYHMEHHRYQGHDTIDTDIPTEIEGWIVSHTGNNYVLHCLMKALFLTFQLAFYAIRPMIVRPSTFHNAANTDPWFGPAYWFQIAVDVAVFFLLGWKSLLYLAVSTFFAGSIHPIAGHFIAEHYIFDDPANETYSYYGFLNIFTYNVGYHNEHHDFPNIPWTKLPEVRRIAAEYYDKMPQVKSWWGVIVRFIFDDSVTPFNRLKRPHRDTNAWDKLVLTQPAAAAAAVADATAGEADAPVAAKASGVTARKTKASIKA